MDKVKKILLAVAAFFAGLAYLFYEKNKTAEGLLQNQQTKEELTKIDEKIANVQGQETAEEQKREEIKQNMQDEEKKDVSKDDLVEFFNKPSNSK